MSKVSVDLKPKGELAIRTVAMPADTNPGGKIFGGWVLSQMDLAGASAGKKYSNTLLVTVAIEAMEFISPIQVGDFVCCYTDIIKTGKTSVTVNIETWAVAPDEQRRRKVTEGVFVYVAVDKSYKPIPLKNLE